MKIALIIFFIHQCYIRSTVCNYIINKNTVDPPAVCPCEYKYEPICGGDNITYINRCILRCNNDVNRDKGYAPISEESEGECDTCICQNIDLPVCTLDGETYPNECELSCENVRRIKNKIPIIYLAYRKSCVGPPCYCPNIASPVCGTDNVLYRNKCVLDCASTYTKGHDLSRLSLKNNGACLDGFLCPRTKDPICGSDGNIHNNLCELECENKRLRCSKRATVTVADKSVCEGCFCTAEYEPVCGSDGRTYSNLCQLLCETKLCPSLHFVSNGTCPTSFCTSEYDPVCGSNRHTYRNECELRWANEAEHFISVFHHGACQPYACDCSYCSKEYKPVCGNGHLTYWNLCWLNCNADCHERGRQKHIFFTRNEACFV